MHTTLKSWVEAAEVLIELNSRSFKALHSSLASLSKSEPGLSMLEKDVTETLSAAELYQKLFDSYDDALIEGYVDLRQRCLSSPRDSILLFPARTLFEMATRRAPLALSKGTRPRKICVTTDFTALAFSGALGYSREEYLDVLEQMVDDPELPKSYTLTLNQVIDAIEADDKSLFDALLLDLKKAESTGLRKEPVNEEWLWEAPQGVMFSNISHLVSGNPFTVMYLHKEDLAVWRFYAVLLQSDMYILRLCEELLPELPNLVSEAQETTYRRLQEENEKVLQAMN